MEQIYSLKPNLGLYHDIIVGTKTKPEVLKHLPTHFLEGMRPTAPLQDEEACILYLDTYESNL